MRDWVCAAAPHRTPTAEIFLVLSIVWLLLLGLKLKYRWCLVAI